MSIEMVIKVTSSLVALGSLGIAYNTYNNEINKQETIVRNKLNNEYPSMLLYDMNQEGRKICSQLPELSKRLIERISTKSHNYKGLNINFDPSIMCSWMLLGVVTVNEERWDKFKEMDPLNLQLSPEEKHELDRIRESVHRTLTEKKKIVHAYFASLAEFELNGVIKSTSFPSSGERFNFATRHWLMYRINSLTWNGGVSTNHHEYIEETSGKFKNDVEEWKRIACTGTKINKFMKFM
jgi:hypothetical protein